MIYVGVVSLGCSKNLVDTENMLGLLVQFGYRLTPNVAQADVIVINTCGFIQSAKEESINTILEMAAHKKAKCSTLVVTGCLTQRYREELKEELPEVDIFLGVKEYDLLAHLLDKRYTQQEKEQDAQQEQGKAHNADHAMLTRFSRVLTTPSHYAYLRIADGCDNRCAYCAIPSIRGKMVSKPIEALVAEAKQLVASGVQELIVIAQDTTRYGLDLYGKRCLADLLHELARTNAKWIRVMYAYPDDIDDALLDVMSEHDNIVKYLDMPMQHVDDALLHSMNRRGKYESLVKLIEKIRAKNQGFVLRTTYIVGFPGETRAQFNALEQFISQCPIERAGVFVYSSEEGTPAASFPGQVEEQVKQRRLDALMRQQQKISLRFHQLCIGNTYEVLTHGKDESSQMYIGRYYAQAPDIDGVVYFKSAKPVAIGAFVQVKIQKALEYDLIGEAL